MNTMSKQAAKGMHPAWFTAPAGTAIGAILANALANKPSLTKTMLGAGLGGAAGAAGGFHEELKGLFDRVTTDKAAPASGGTTESAKEQLPRALPPQAGRLNLLRETYGLKGRGDNPELVSRALKSLQAYGDRTGQSIQDMGRALSGGATEVPKRISQAVASLKNTPYDPAPGRANLRKAMDRSFWDGGDRALLNKAMQSLNAYGEVSGQTMEDMARKAHTLSTAN